MRALNDQHDQTLQNINFCLQIPYHNGGKSHCYWLNWNSCLEDLWSIHLWRNWKLNYTRSWDIWSNFKRGPISKEPLFWWEVGLDDFHWTLPTWTNIQIWDGKAIFYVNMLNIDFFPRREWDLKIKGKKPSKILQKSLSVYIYVYIWICIYIYFCI